MSLSHKSAHENSVRGRRRRETNCFVDFEKRERMIERKKLEVRSK